MRWLAPTFVIPTMEIPGGHENGSRCDVFFLKTEVPRPWVIYESGLLIFWMALLWCFWWTHDNMYISLSRWWFQIFSPVFGEDSHFDEYFQMGWNHQPDVHIPLFWISLPSLCCFFFCRIRFQKFFFYHDLRCWGFGSIAAWKSGVFVGSCRGWVKDPPFSRERPWFTLCFNDQPSLEMLQIWGS